MKKRLFVWTLAIGLSIAGLVVVPDMIQTSIPSIYYVTPTVKSYENVVNSSGVIQSENVYVVYASDPFVAANVRVLEGDLVYGGQKLLDVDEDATAGLGGGAAALLGASGAASGFSAADIESLLLSTGLSSLFGGADISAFLEGGAVQETQSAATVATPVSADSVAAPAAGIVTQVGVYPGATAPAGKELFTIQDIKNYIVKASVSEADISKIKVGDKALIRGTGFSDTTFRGYVSQISPTAHKVLSGTSSETVVDVEVKILNPDNRLKPGFSAKVEITGGNSHEMITVPYEAIRQDERNEEYVYVYEDGVLRRAHVITGRELVSEVEILQGVSFDSVVIFNPDDVSGEGSIVNIKGRATVD